ncbi:MAG: hypothetical protein KC496_16600 [Anaerolineae bacterium]|nr:hypothetical protein [Anaerolineae bacterium]
MRNLSRFTFLMIFLAGCLPQNAVPPTPTPSFVASPTVQIRNSEELYGNTALGGQNNPTAAALPNSAGLPPQQIGTAQVGAAQAVEIVLADSRIVQGDLYLAGDTLNRVPGVLLLNADRSAWGELPRQVQAAGYTLLLVDSTALATEDLSTLLESLSETGAVDPGRIAVIGAESGADLALLGCTIYPICDAAVLLSPRSQETLVNVLPNYNPRPLFVVAAQSDTEGFSTAAALARGYANGSQFVEMASGSGTGLLSLNSNLAGDIIGWLDQVLSSS